MKNKTVLKNSTGMWSQGTDGLENSICGTGSTGPRSCCLAATEEQLANTNTRYVVLFGQDQCPGNV
uniref:Uncharacterized protein n=1 Tax=Oryza punctata TaxID=4537 RepID=A0A0E0K900_ORYPU